MPVVVTDSGWLRGAASTPLPRVGDTEDPSAIFLTSGSTGVAKAALLSHRATWLRAIARETEDGSPGRKGEVVMFGLFHMAGWYFLEHAWAVNRPVHLVHRADADELLTAVERWRASTLYAIPAVWQRMLDDGARCDDASSLREVLTGTSRVDLDLVDALKTRFPGSWTSVAYGSTEIGRGAVLADADLFVKPLSVGLPPPAVEARIDADSELLQRGPTMFSGYLDRPDATADAIDADGWYHTGDLATCDADGYLTITGRRSEGIRSGGEWIAPVEVEAAVLTHPAVAEVGVVGLPDPHWGELVCAAIVTRPGATVPTVEELRAHLAPRLIAPKHPRVVVGVDAASSHRRHRPDPPCRTARERSSPTATVQRVSWTRTRRPPSAPNAWPRSCSVARLPRAPKPSRNGFLSSRRRMRAARVWPSAAARSAYARPTSTTR